MAAEISIGDQFLWVSNSQLRSLVELAVGVGSQLAGANVERSSVAQLDDYLRKLWPGQGFDLGELFSSIEERKFWAKVFRTISINVYQRKLGNHQDPIGPTWLVGDSYVVFRMLTRSVQEKELGWHPDWDISEGAPGGISIRG